MTDDVVADARAALAKRTEQDPGSAGHQPRHLEGAGAHAGLVAVVDALALLHEIAARGVPSGRPEWTTVHNAVVRAGRALEDATDVERPPRAVDVIARVVEPELAVIGDAVARLLGHALAPGRDDVVAGDADVAALAEGLARVVEGELSTAALVGCGVHGFDVPRPWSVVFSPERHHLAARGAGPRDVIVALERAGRVGQGGRVVSAAQVIVGSGT